MKKLIIISFLITITVSTSSCAQTIIPLEQRGEILRNINDTNDYDNVYIPPTPVYFKDINNYLDKYVGTWEGTFDNKTYKLYVVPKIYEYTDPNIKRDALEMRYTITDNSTGDIIVDTSNLPDDSRYMIIGRDLTPGGRSYGGRYMGYDCEQFGQIAITMNENNPTILKLRLMPAYELMDFSDCGPIRQIFPVDEWMTLVKQ